MTFGFSICIGMAGGGSAGGADAINSFGRTGGKGTLAKSGDVLALGNFGKGAATSDPARSGTASGWSGNLAGAGSAAIAGGSTGGAGFPAASGAERSDFGGVIGLPGSNPDGRVGGRGTPCLNKNLRVEG